MRVAAPDQPLRRTLPCPSLPLRYVLVNDWSARDIQRWEYVPLGPFTSKNFVSRAGAEGWCGGSRGHG